MGECTRGSYSCGAAPYCSLHALRALSNFVPNIGFASLTMSKDLGLTPAMFGLGAGIFFVGYFLFEGRKEEGLRLYKNERQKKPVFCPTTKRLEVFGTMRADFLCAEWEVMHAATYTIKERLLTRL